MSKIKHTGTKASRGSYSRLICLGCQERRIRCELPCGVEMPNRGELSRVQPGCYRCERLRIPCIVRQTILGRPNRGRSGTSTAESQTVWTGHVPSRNIIELSLQARVCAWPVPTLVEPQVDTMCSLLPFSIDLPPNPTGSALSNGNTLSIHTPQSPETALLIRALDTLRCENVEEEWFQHLPAHFGYTRALDLCIEALVVACAYARGVPKFTSNDCYQTLISALNAVQASIRQSHGEPNDLILASTALLAPFEGVIKKNGVVTRLHVDGLATILAARSATYPITSLARDILDFNARETGILACIQGTFSPFENVSRAYYASDRVGYGDSDRAQLRSLSTEVFIRIPRLVRLVRSLRLQRTPLTHLQFDALRLTTSLLSLQDSQAESRLQKTSQLCSSGDLPGTFASNQSVHFASTKDYEALAYYWQSRLSVLRLEWHLHNLSMPGNAQADCASQSAASRTRADEMFRLAKNIIMSLEYGANLRLHKHARLLAHATVVVWGVIMMDIPAAFSHYMDEEEVNNLSDVLLRRVNIALPGKPNLVPNDMNMAADIFVGGQPRGIFAELYSL